MPVELPVVIPWRLDDRIFRLPMGVVPLSLNGDMSHAGEGHGGIRGRERGHSFLKFV